MSASAMVETYDMPMTDYNEDGDIPMAGSSSENWFQPFPHMDEDALHFNVPSESLEVDMMAFEESTTEYEMADEAVQPHDTNVDANVIDAEVYDMAIHSSPFAQTDMAEGHVMQSHLPETNAAVTEEPQLDSGPHLPANRDGESDGNSTEIHNSEHASITNAHDNGHEHHNDESEPVRESTSFVGRPEEVPNTDEAHSTLTFESATTSLQPDVLEGRSDKEDDGKPPDLSAEDVSSELPVNQEEAASEHAEDDEVHQTEHDPGDSEQIAEQSELHATHQAYMQPPPIFLSLQVTSAEGDQPEFVLFSLPETSSHSAEEPLLLLQHHSALFYEPVSAVFEAFRQEEYFSHLEELSDAEMALNAYELQLVISEDNIYAREVSLQDLYAMHQGVGLPGHLRLTLQSIVPRFISRYNHLREQITRLVLTHEAENTQEQTAPVEEEHDEEEEGHAAQEYTDSCEPERHHGGDLEKEAVETIKGAESAETDNRSDEEDEAASKKHDKEGSPENIEGRNVLEQSVHSDDLEYAVKNLDKGLLHENDDDTPVEDDDGSHDLDADAALHAKVFEGSIEPSAEEEELATEYVDVAEPHEEDNESYGDDFGEVGEDGTGTAAHATDPAATFDDVHPEENTDEVQQGTMSHTTTTSSFDEGDSSWEDAADENDVSGDVVGETNQSVQQTSATVFDEEGNYTDGFEGGDEDFGEDDFGEEGFDNSAEDTLEDPTEEREALVDGADALQNAEKDDEAARAVLEESEKFVSSLENDEDTEATNAGATADDGVKRENVEHHAAIETASERPKTMHKNSSKRSLDDAELNDEELVSLSSSPDSKRTRTL